MSNFNSDQDVDPVYHRKNLIARGTSRTVVIFLQKLIWLLSQKWLWLANMVSGIILFLGFLAPIFMSFGLTDAGQSVYDFLAPHNHQLPQRSYFLFGESQLITSYSLEQILAAGADIGRLQDFVGNPEMGFKMALNHRMTAIFVAIFFGGVAWGLAGRRPRLGPLWFIVLLLPLLIDGFSHLISENSGQGFRESNTWAVQLTGNAFPDKFYRETTIGSLNWLLRTITGILFGLGFVWFLFTYLSIRFQAIQLQLEPKLRAINAAQKTLDQ